MPLLADRVKEASATTGTGTINLGGAAAGFQSFASAFASGSSVYYTIAAGSEWEVGYGTYTTAVPDTLSRDVVLDSSNAGALVDFSTGAKDVFCTIPAAFLDTKADLDSPVFTGTVGGITSAMVGLGNVNNTSDVDKPVSTAQASADTAAENAAKAYADSLAGNYDAVGSASTAETNAKAYADGLVVGLWDDRGAYDASVNTFPASGGSGAAGAILKGDIWTVSVAGALGGVSVGIGDTARALSDTPGQIASNWALQENNIGYVPENVANKVTSLSGASTDAQYPSAKLAYDQLALKLNASLVSAAALTVLDDATVSDMVDTLGGAASTGTGGLVRATSPSLVTPKSTTTIGVGNATPAASGAGITFPATQSASSDANTLDDYEEGTFTPTIVGLTDAGAGTYISQVGKYTKVGNRVFFHLFAGWSAHTGTGNMRVDGLPFVMASSTSSYSPVTCGEIYNIAMTAGYFMAAYAATGVDYITLKQIPTGGGASANIPLDTAGQMMLSGHYNV